MPCRIYSPEKPFAMRVYVVELKNSDAKNLLVENGLKDFIVVGALGDQSPAVNIKEASGEFAVRGIK
jgi:hypothetical protein